jgi:hypothetical protein
MFVQSVGKTIGVVSAPRFCGGGDRDSCCRGGRHLSFKIESDNIKREDVRSWKI